MTTVVANPAGRKSARDKKVNPSKSANLPNSTSVPNETELASNSSDEFARKNDKFQPTVEQLRLASLMHDKKEDSELKRKIEQVCELTGASREDASIALYDCDNDVTKAVEMILDGDTLDSEWQSTGKKKNKAKGQAAPASDNGLTNGSKKFDKTQRSNAKTNNGSNSTAAGGRSQRPAGNSPPKGAVPRRIVNSNNRDVKPNEIQKSEFGEEDIFAKAGGAGPEQGNSRRAPNSNNRRGGPGGGSGPRGPRGAPRGGPRVGGPTGAPRASERGPRTFNNNRGPPSDTFPNSIDTWSNNPAEPAKAVNDDLNTMTVGNWSDIVAANEDWSTEEDWTSSPMETKVFTPSTKVIPEKDELVEQNKLTNSNANASQMKFLPGGNKVADEPQQPTMSSIISGNIKRQQQAQAQQQAQPQPATAGQALLQQIQQNRNHNQYPLSQFSKTATESIKTLVGLNSNNMLPNDIISGNDSNLDGNLSQATKQTQQVSVGATQNRLKTQQQQQSRASKIPESAVEMPADQMANLSVHFGSLEFGTNNSFSIGANDSNLFDTVSQNKKTDGKNLNMLSSGDSNANSNTNYRQTQQQQQQQQQAPNPHSANVKSNMMPPNVMPQRLNDAIINSDHRSDNKALNSNSYNSNKVAPNDRKTNEYLNSFKPYANENSVSTYSANYQTSVPVNSYYSNVNQAQLFNAAVSQTLMGNSGANTNVYGNAGAYGNANANVNNTGINKLRDIDNTNTSVQQQSTQSQQVNQPSSTANKAYDSSSVTSAGNLLMSNSTVTTNVLKNALPASKNVHSVPPGVQQPQPVLSTPYIMNNTAMQMAGYSPYPTYDPFQTRDHGYSPYATQDVKFNRANDNEAMLPVSSQAAGAVPTASQAHNQPYYPPGYGFYFGFPHQPLYNAAQHPLYPVAQPQTTASAGSAFAKAPAAANYGSHSYNSGYDSLGTSVAPQTQDYVNKNYQQQQMQQHKPMSGTNSADLSGNNQQSLYNKQHQQINKNYDNKNFQNSQQQFNLSNAAQSNPNMSSYSPYMLPQPAMHHSLSSADGGQQPTGVANQRTMPPTHKGAGSTTTGGYSKFGWN